MFSKLLSICFSGDDWGHSFNIIVNYEDDYLKHHYVNKTMLFLSSERLNLRPKKKKCYVALTQPKLKNWVGRSGFFFFFFFFYVP